MINFKKSIFLIAFVLISHFLLPVFNGGKDFLFFTTWNLFAGGPSTDVYDLRFKADGRHLLRDAEPPIWKAQFRYYSVFTALSNKENKAFTPEFKKMIETLCNCKTDELEKVRYSGSLYDHLILKKDLPIIESQNL